MAKYYGAVGFVETKETAPGSGKWKKEVTEYSYKGDVIKNSRRLESGDKTNEDIVVDNIISIIADPYANQKFFAIRYVRWMGVNWIVSNVEVQSPRLLLTLGGIYNGQTK
jgi:hypothetical protein